MKKLLLSFFIFAFTTASFAQISSYQQLIDYSFKNSLKIKELKQKKISNLEAAQIDQGAFAYKISGSLLHQDSTVPQTNNFTATDSQARTAQIGIEKKLKLGITPYASYSLGKYSETRGIIGQSKYKNSNIHVGIRTDLLKSLILGSDRAQHKQTEFKKQWAEATEKYQIEEYLKSIYTQALILHQSHLLHKNRIEKCKSLHSFFKLTKKRWNSRLIEQRDFLLSETQYESCLIEKSILKNKINNEELALKSLIQSPSKDLNINNAQWDWPFQNKSFEISKPALEKLAKRRLDYKVTQLSLETSKLNWDKSKNNELPSIELDSSVKYGGADASSLNKASQQSLDRDFPDYRVSLNFKIPIGQSSEKSLMNKAKADYELTKEQWKQFKNIIVFEIQSTVNHLELLKKSIKRRKHITNLERRKWKYYQRDFKRGRSSFKDLMDNNNSYIDSLDRLSKDQLDFSTHYLTYLLQTGHNFYQP